MPKLDIYCTTIKYFKVLENLPSYITPVGLGDNIFPDHWITEKKGTNISNLNKYYAEFTMFYWMWKNKTKTLNKDDLIGSCQHRYLWLDKKYLNKQRPSIKSLYSQLLKVDNKNLYKNDVTVFSPIIFSKKNLLEDFEEVHKNFALRESIGFLNLSDRKKFQNHLQQNKLFSHNMFITNSAYFVEYCEAIFPWLDKCLKYCEQNKLLTGYNLRLPAFLGERFTSFWFSQFKKRHFLSFARLGSFFLSNKVNSIVNPLKLPFTFNQYPTIHKY
jgi:hypothetical protein